MLTNRKAVHKHSCVILAYPISSFAFSVRLSLTPISFIKSQPGFPDPKSVKLSFLKLAFVPLIAHNKPALSVKFPIQKLSSILIARFKHQYSISIEFPIHYSTLIQNIHMIRRVANFSLSK